MPKFILVPRKEDPNAPENTAASYKICASIRRSRAHKEARRNYGFRLYEWSSPRNGWIPAHAVEIRASR